MEASNSVLLTWQISFEHLQYCPSLALTRHISRHLSPDRAHATLV